MQVGRVKEQAEPVEGATGVERFATKRAAVLMLASLTKHSVELASEVTAQGGLATAMDCLQDEDSEVREGAGG